MKNSPLTPMILLLIFSPWIRVTGAFSQTPSAAQFQLIGIQTPSEKEKSTAHASEQYQANLRHHLEKKGWQYISHGNFAPLPVAQKSKKDPQRRLEKTIENASRAYENGSIEKALPLYMDAIEILSSLEQPTPKQVQLLAELRLNTANRLLALQGFETNANTLLKDALKANPHLELNTAQYPPRLRKRFAQVRNTWAKENKNDFMIRSTPSAAVVFVEGHSVGLTPLHLLNHISDGTYRVWVEKEGIRSATRRLDINSQAVEEGFDFQTQYYFQVSDQSFHLDPKEVQLHAFLTSLQNTLTTAPFILTGILATDETWTVFTVTVEPENIFFITTEVTSLSEKELMDVSEKQAQAILNRNLELLPQDNFFNPKAIQIKSVQGSQWQTWSLMGLSTAVLAATVSVAFLLWPTTEQEGQLQISVVP